MIINRDITNRELTWITLLFERPDDVEVKRLTMFETTYVFINLIKSSPANSEAFARIKNYYVEQNVVEFLNDRVTLEQLRKQKINHVY